MTDWQELCDGMAAWLSRVSGIPPHDIAWDWAIEGMRGYPYLDLRFSTHRAEGIDEIEVNEDDVVQSVGNRVRTLSIRAVTRDQEPPGKAYVVLERIRDRLWLPSSQAALSALGVGLQDASTVVDLSVVRTLRHESEAVLDLTLNMASCEAEAPGYAETVVGVIEHVEVGGTAQNVTETITVPDRTIPPLPL